MDFFWHKLRKSLITHFGLARKWLTDSLVLCVSSYDSGLCCEQVFGCIGSFCSLALTGCEYDQTQAVCQSVWGHSAFQQWSADQRCDGSHWFWGSSGLLQTSWVAHGSEMVHRNTGCEIPDFAIVVNLKDICALLENLRRNIYRQCTAPTSKKYKTRTPRSSRSTVSWQSLLDQPCTNCSVMRSWLSRMFRSCSSRCYWWPRSLRMQMWVGVTIFILEIICYHKRKGIWMMVDLESVEEPKVVKESEVNRAGQRLRKDLHSERSPAFQELKRLIQLFMVIQTAPWQWDGTTVTPVAQQLGIDINSLQASGRGDEDDIFDWRCCSQETVSADSQIQARYWISIFVPI